MAKDYYLILGVSRNADQEEIKSAYRRAVKDHHPDVSKSPDKEKFIEIQEAYDVLKDPEKKKAYDESLKRAERKIGPIFRGFSHHFRPSRRDPFFSFFDELFEDITSAFSHSFHPSGRNLYSAEIILSPKEAERGGYLPLSVPIHQICYHCQGRGRLAIFRCPECYGKGYLVSNVDVKIRIPPKIRHGTILEVDLHQLGINAIVELRVIIS